MTCVAKLEQHNRTEKTPTRKAYGISVIIGIAHKFGRSCTYVHMHICMDGPPPFGFLFIAGKFIIANPQRKIYKAG